MTNITLGTISQSQNSNNVAISADHFGGVIVHSTSAWENGVAQNGFDHITMDAINDLGMTTLRYPGGTESETSLDWSADQNMSGRPIKLQDVKQAIDVCAANGLKFSFSVPTQEFAPDGPTSAQIQQMHEYVQEVAEYAITKNVEFASLKIGNEYDVGQNAITPQQYGDIASALSPAIGTAIEDAYQSSPMAEPDVLIESGRSWMMQNPNMPSAPYDSGSAGLTPNGQPDYKEIMDQFNATEASYIDGVDIHNLTLDITYTEALPGTSSSYTYGGSQAAVGGSNIQGNGGNYYYGLQHQLEELISHWNTANGSFSNSDLEFHSMAWSLPNAGKSYIEKDGTGSTGPSGASLANAPLLFLQMHNFSSVGVESAYYWSPAKSGANNVNAFVLDAKSGQNIERPAAEVFTAMQNQLQGYTAVDFENDPSAGATLVRVFKNDNNEAVIYVANLSNTDDTITLDADTFLTALGGDGVIDSASAIKFSSAAGSSASDHNGSVNLSNMSMSQIINSSGDFEFTLSGNGMIQITLEDIPPLTITGTSGNDSLIGTNESETFEALGGNDYIRGKGGDDTIFGGDGKNHINGDKGDDLIFGGNARDIIKGGKGHDEIYGQNGGDKLNGWAGDDLIFGGNHGDQLGGQSGNDQLFGDAGNDRLNGGSGNDIINGGSGWDRLTGGSGADTFVFNNGDGWCDYVYDFQNGLDTIDLSGTTKQYFGQLNIENGHDSQGNAGAIVNYGNGSIFLSDVNANILDSSDFDFG